MTTRLLHSTNIQEENIKVGVSTKHGYWVDIIGQLKIEINIYQVISSNQLWYSTWSNNKYYIINNYSQVHTWGLKPRYHTHLGIMFIRLSILTSFKIHYLYLSCVGTWHSAPSIFINPLVSVRDTPIPYYYVSKRDTPIPYYYVSERYTPIP